MVPITFLQVTQGPRLICSPGVVSYQFLRANIPLWKVLSYQAMWNARTSGSKLAPLINWILGSNMKRKLSSSESKLPPLYSRDPDSNGKWELYISGSKFSPLINRILGIKMELKLSISESNDTPLLSWSMAAKWFASCHFLRANSPLC